MSATCVDYDTYWRLTVILLILFLLFALLVIGCLRDVPVVCVMYVWVFVRQCVCAHILDVCTYSHI